MRLACQLVAELLLVAAYGLFGWAVWHCCWPVVAGWFQARFDEDEAKWIENEERE